MTPFHGFPRAAMRAVPIRSNRVLSGPASSLRTRARVVDERPRRHARAPQNLSPRFGVPGIAIPISLFPASLENSERGHLGETLCFKVVPYALS